MKNIKEKIPMFGFGTDKIKEGKEIINAITWAINAGYRLIDTADCYFNEAGIGIAIYNCLDSGVVAREDLFITSKVPDWKQGYDSTIKCFNESLKKLNLEYIDLYLIHSPIRNETNWKRMNIDSWRALEKLYRDGKVKHIGVANYSIHHLEFLLAEAEISPEVNQIEIHPQHQQRELVRYCNSKGLAIEAWAPLNQGRIFKNEMIGEIAEKYNKNVAQIAVRWSIQKGFIPLVRSINKNHIEQNFNILDFEISDSDIQYIDTLDGQEFSNIHHDGILPVPANHILNPDCIVQKNATAEIWRILYFIPILTKRKITEYKFHYLLFGIIPLFSLAIKKGHYTNLLKRFCREILLSLFKKRYTRLTGGGG
jgi:diketogulonate reductase-like aldo/keto reductase